MLERSCRAPRTLSLALLLALALGSAATAGGMFISAAVAVWRYPQRATVSCAAETLVVMGAAQYDGRPSPAFQRRLDRALELYRAGCARRILVTGGQRPGDRYSEGEAGVRYLAARGVPPEALASETTSATSFENLRNSRPLVAGERLIIVTDDWHSYRTQWLAHYLGLEAELAPVATRRAPAYWLRESLSVLAYRLGWIR